MCSDQAGLCCWLAIDGLSYLIPAPCQRKVMCPDRYDHLIHDVLAHTLAVPLDQSRCRSVGLIVIRVAHAT